MRQRRQAGRPTRGVVGHDVADVDLAVRAASGEIPAFDELYRRHVQAAWRVAQAITGNPHDAADAVSDAFTRVFQALPHRLEGGGNFRPYILASVRNASIDVLRRRGRTSPSDNEDVLDGAAVGREPPDLLLADVDSDMVAAAFRALPERWRTVLWLTEVENMPAREVAVLLGISANGVAQLAVRARAGLRERFLQAHLHKGEVRQECRATVANLGAYAGGGLAARDISKVDQHLAGCGACRERVGELRDLSQTLHRSVPPLPVFLAAATTAKWLAAPGGGAGGAGGAGGGAGAAAGTAGAKLGAGAGAGAAKTAGAGITAIAAKAGAGVAAVTSAVGGTTSLAVASVALLAAGLLGVKAVDPAGPGSSPGTAGAPAQGVPAGAPDGTAAVQGSVIDPLADHSLPGVEVPPVRPRRIGTPSPEAPAVDSGDLTARDPAGDAQRAVPAVDPLAELGTILRAPLAAMLGLARAAPVCPGASTAGVTASCPADDPASGPEPSRSGRGIDSPDGRSSVPVPAATPAPAQASRDPVPEPSERQAGSITG